MREYATGAAFDARGGAALACRQRPVFREEEGRMAVETLFLDAGGVLVFPNWPLVSETLGRHGVAADAARLAVADMHAKRQLDTPGALVATNDAQRGWLYFNLVLDHAGIARSEATDRALEELHAYHAVHNLWELVPPDVPPALARLRALAPRLVVVSNANGRLRFLMERLGLDRFFGVMLDSHEEGVEKPDPRLFERALVRSGGRAETTLHVGDLYHVDVRGARAAGLRAVLLDTAGLYPDADCPRVASLGELAERLENGDLA
jgi:putative hydrolase of the HAD superfamily